eukprot:Hpha_TRINITY_DN23007_c0_g1::TRINITY_DN23007_c0_g1_i1::g.109434::m.109434/K07198/PRKAA, AMPK; 5'-AMP-activated protein kinase, catalytic alpha subunit
MCIRDEYHVRICSRSELEGSDKGLRRMREVQAALRVAGQHPHVVGLVDVLLSEKRIFLVEELVHGELCDLLNVTRRFDEGRARRYFQQMVAGVRCLHHHGLRHLDLDDGSFMLDASANVVVSGLRLFPTFVREAISGVPSFAAPECLRFGPIGEAADVWSLGVFLYTMVMGGVPFHDIQYHKVFARIERAEYPPAEHVSSALKDLIRGIFVADPARRLTIEGVVSHSWFQQDLDPSLLRLPDAPPPPTPVGIVEVEEMKLGLDDSVVLGNEREGDDSPPAAAVPAGTLPGAAG